MTALDFFESQLITDASSIIDKTSNKFTKHELIVFAEAYLSMAVKEIDVKEIDVKEIYGICEVEDCNNSVYEFGDRYCEKHNKQFFHTFEWDSL